MTPLLICALIPALNGCSVYHERVPSLHDLSTHRAAYTAQKVAVTGTVRDLRQWHYSDGFRSEIFFVCLGADCVHVYEKGNSPIHNGQGVTVYGTYYAVFHAGAHEYRNEIEADEIIPGS